MKNSRVSVFRIFRWFAVSLLLTSVVLGQQQGSAPAGPPAVQKQGPEVANPEPRPEQQAASQAVQPERKISKQEADELFRSVDEILAFVSKDTGLAIKHEVKRRLASREEVSKYIADRMKDDEDSKRLARSEVVLKKFALIPQQFDLRSFLTDLLKEQVAGFYDTKKKTVFLLDWVEPEAQKPVLAHELTHALQDQNFDLDKWAKANSQSSDKPKGAPPAKPSIEELMEDERIAARQAVTEGQAMVVLIDYMLAGNGQSVKDNPRIADAVMAGMAATGETPLYAKAPMFLKQLLLFPYQRGLKFEVDVLVKSGTQTAFTGVLQNPPVDSRQILQPETYLNKENLAPMPVPDFVSAAGRQYHRYDMSVMGQFDVWLLARQYEGQDVADALSPKWRGGYYYAALKPGSPKPVNGVEVPTTSIALAYASKWATPAAAEQFAALYAKYLPKRYKTSKQVEQSASASGDQTKAAAEGLRLVHRWETEEGVVTVETLGDTMLVVEGFDPTAAEKIREAVFGK